MQYLICLIAFIFIGGMIYTMLTCEKCPPFITYRKTLRPEQLTIYQKVMKERLEIATQGLILGLAIGIGYIFWFRKSLSPTINACTFTAIIIVTQYIYYILRPKLSMLLYMDSKKQVEAWYDIYKFMQYRYHIGMLIGGIGYMLLGYGLTS